MTAPPPWVLVSAGFHFAAGQAKAVAWLADYLARTGVPVHLVGNEFDATLIARPEVTVHRCIKVRGADAIGFADVARQGRTVARRVTRLNPTARVVVNGGNCLWGDINWVHYLHGAWKPDLAAAPAAVRLKERVIGGWYRRDERRALRMAKLIIANSKFTAAGAARIAGIPPEDVRTVYLGTDAGLTPATAGERESMRRQLGLPPEGPLVAFVGGFGHDNRKGYDVLLAAWRSLCGSGDWDAGLVMAGGGKAISAVAEGLKRDGLDNRVRLVGFTQRVYELLAACDLLVSPVRYEPYGLNVQEAICRGLPAIVTRTAGVAEEYPPELGEMLLPEPDQPAALEGLLRKWRGDIPGWKSKFAGLGERLRSRTWDDMSREIVAASKGSR